MAILTGHAQAWRPESRCQNHLKR